MEIKTMEVGGFNVNCSILSEGGRCWIVDPGQDARRLVDELRTSSLEPVAILLTHGHFDHIGAIPQLQTVYPDLPVGVHPNDIRVISHPLNQYPPDYPPIATPRNLASPKELDCPKGLEVIETPGHTPGGVCYFFRDFQPSRASDPQGLLLSGDTLFAGSIGRTDLPGGDMPTLMRSLERLAELPDDTLVVPGHGPRTTIAAEKRDNPFLRG